MAVLKSEERSERCPSGEPSLSEQSSAKLYEDSYDDYRHGCGRPRHSVHRQPDEDESENDLDLSDEQNQKVQKRLEENCEEAFKFAVNPLGETISREWRGFTNTPGNYLMSEATFGLSQLLFPVDYK